MTIMNEDYRDGFVDYLITHSLLETAKKYKMSESSVVNYKNRWFTKKDHEDFKMLRKDKRREEFMELYREGFSQMEMAKNMNVTRSVITYYKHKYIDNK